jgi:peptidoglycan hydrolase-like protein with peptidoglycan-binding domain
MTDYEEPLTACHDDPRLGEQDVTDLDVAMQQTRESVNALKLQQGSPEELPLPLEATLRKAAFYPPANRTAQFYGDRMSAVNFSFIRAVVLHSTETSGMPGYQGGASAPNLTAIPDFTNKKLVWRHHWRLNQSARALVHPSGVQTNNSNVVQVELVGTTARGGPGLFIPDAPEWWEDELAKFLAFMHQQWGVPLTSSVRWKSYPASYGTSNGVRLSASSWLAYKGVLAHQHVYGNDHGDVWLDKIKRILAKAGGAVVDPPTRPDPPNTFSPFPLPAGWWFGPANGGRNSISGMFTYKNKLTPWQLQMKKRGWTLSADGVYGPQTAKTAKAFQSEKNLVADGLVGRQTWDAAWTAKVT